ncbi:MAG: nucleoside deaminase [Magnetococcales bacterium]|nr:nucleoside deaminase [Magnetococcales bacterium]
MTPPAPATGPWLPPERSHALLALVQAAEAGLRDEIPVGALLVDPLGRPLAATGNRSTGCADPAGHAEMAALRLGSARTGNFRLTGTTLSVSLEPCPMCSAACATARLASVRCALRRDSTPGSDAAAEHGAASAALLRFFFAPKRKPLSLEQLSG